VNTVKVLILLYGTNALYVSKKKKTVAAELPVDLQIRNLI